MTALRWTSQEHADPGRRVEASRFPGRPYKGRGTLETEGLQLASESQDPGRQGAPRSERQFEHINRRVMACQRRGQPAVSVDTKKKEVLGNRKNAGRTYRRRGKPREVDTHDFPDAKLGKAIPYGVYDLANNDAWVSVGIDHDTAEFAVASIAEWWKRIGRSATQRQASVDYRRQWWQQRSSKPAVEG